MAVDQVRENLEEGRHQENFAIAQAKEVRLQNHYNSRIKIARELTSKRQEVIEFKAEIKSLDYWNNNSVICKYNKNEAGYKKKL